MGVGGGTRNVQRAPIYTYDAGFLMFLDVTGNEMPKPCKMILVGNSKSIIPFFGLVRPRNMKK